MIILAGTLGIKVLLSIFYYVGYFCVRIKDQPLGNKRSTSKILE
jgi:hypothetical protein